MGRKIKSSRLPANLSQLKSKEIKTLENQSFVFCNASKSQRDCFK